VEYEVFFLKRWSKGVWMRWPLLVIIQPATILVKLFLLF